VVHRLVESGRRVEREDEKRRDRDDTESDLPSGPAGRFAGEAREDRAPGLETGAVSRHDRNDQNAGPQQAERGE
jgi:hypothetical protein